MGNGFTIRCEKCGYEFTALLGVGMKFPSEYEQTVKAIKDGIYGEEYKKFFEEHPNAAVNCELITAVCEECGRLDSVMDMSLYLPVDDSVLNAGYVTKEELESDFKKCKEYNRKCTCGGHMRTFDLLDELFLRCIKCPQCENNMTLTEDLVDWD